MKYALRVVLLLIAASFGLPIGANQTARVNRVAVVLYGAAVGDLPQINGLRAGLEELRYMEGENLLLKLIHDENLPLLRDRLRAELRRGLGSIATMPAWWWSRSKRKACSPVG